MNDLRINLKALTSKTVLASSFAQAVYPRPADAPAFEPPAGFRKLTSMDGFEKASPDFDAETYFVKH